MKVKYKDLENTLNKEQYEELTKDSINYNKIFKQIPTKLRKRYISFESTQTSSRDTENTERKRRVEEFDESENIVVQ